MSSERVVARPVENESNMSHHEHLVTIGSEPKEQEGRRLGERLPPIRPIKFKMMQQFPSDAPCHCTGLGAHSYLRTLFNSLVQEVGAGTRLHFGES